MVGVEEYEIWEAAVVATEKSGPCVRGESVDAKSVIKKAYYLQALRPCEPAPELDGWLQSRVMLLREAAANSISAIPAGGCTYGSRSLLGQ